MMDTTFYKDNLTSQIKHFDVPPTTDKSLEAKIERAAAFINLLTAADSCIIDFYDAFIIDNSFTASEKIQMQIINHQVQLEYIIRANVLNLTAEEKLSQNML